MNDNRGRAWLVAALTIGTIAVAAVVAYNFGLSQGLAQVGAAAGNVPPAYAYGWHRPWGFGFFPVLFIFFWVVLLKSLWWRPWGPWSYWHRGPWSYYGPPPHIRDRFDDWHRQAHERMDKS